MQDYESLLSPDVFADPYPFYAELRSNDPVHLDPLLGCWVVTRYTDVISGLSNRCLSSRRITAERMKGQEWEEVLPLFQIVSRQMLLSDPPDHTRIRGLVSKAFTPRVIHAMRPHIEQIVEQHLDAVQEAKQMDVIRDLAYPLPATVIAEMLGVPAEDQDQFRGWTDDLSEFLGNPHTLEQSKQALQSIYALEDYFHRIIAGRRHRPKDDLMNALILAEEQGDALSEAELIGNCMGFLTAGHATTTHLIGNGLLALLRNPDQMQALQHDFSSIAPAVEELLRYDSPVQYTARLAREETEIGGKRIGRGQGVMLVLGSANRDPLQFADPDRLDITRRENRHLAFGHNIHFCIGFALARLEGQIAIEAVLRRMPALSLATQALQWQENLAFHGLKSLPVTF